MADSTPSPSSHAPPVADSRRLDELHRVTWELELLLSGAVAFALLQVPSVVDEAYLRLEPHLGDRLELAAFFGYYYLKLILYTLISSFLVHLTARAYWVGLIGLHSVFPGGVRWEKLSYGPLVTSELERRLPSIDRMIRAADSFSSSIFSFAFVLVAIFLYSVLMVAVLLGVAAGISALVFDGRHLWWITGALFLLLVAPGMAVTALDKATEKSGGIPPDSRLGLLLGKAYGFNYWAGAQALYAPITMTLFSNISKKVMYPLSVVVFFGLIAVFTVKDVMVGQGRLELESARYIPASAGALEVDPRYYESLRSNDLADSDLPSIQSDMVRESYVRLFIPYEAEGDDPAVEKVCPDLEPAADRALRLRRRRREVPAEERLREVLGCVAGLWRVSLNGARLEDPGFRFYRHPRTGVRGLVAYLPTRGMPLGSNLLVVERVDFPEEEPAGEEDEEPRPPLRHHIPFWI